jgi:hypothetical protein
MTTDPFSILQSSTPLSASSSTPSAREKRFYKLNPKLELEELQLLAK